MSYNSLRRRNLCKFYRHNKRIKLKKGFVEWADFNIMREFYINCPEDMQIDHIIPLNGKNVCGLHVLDNLQYLYPIENLKKRNYFGDFQGWTKEITAEYMKNYVKDNIRVKEYQQKYRDTHKEKTKEYNTKYFMWKKLIKRLLERSNVCNEHM